MSISIRSAILAQIAIVAESQGRQLAKLSDDLPLLDSGLDSLCIAILVANLDDQTGIDPFSGEGDAAFPVTLGDFIKQYENAAV